MLSSVLGIPSVLNNAPGNKDVVRLSILANASNLGVKLDGNKISKDRRACYSWRLDRFLRFLLY